MCETLDDIHDVQLASIISKMRKEQSKIGKQSICN